MENRFSVLITGTGFAGQTALGRNKGDQPASHCFSSRIRRLTAPTSTLGQPVLNCHHTLPVQILIRFGLPKVRATPSLKVPQLPMSPFGDIDNPSYRSVLLSYFQYSSISAGFYVAISGRSALSVALINPKQNQYLPVY